MLVINLYFISQKKTSSNDFDEVSNIVILDLLTVKFSNNNISKIQSLFSIFYTSLFSPPLQHRLRLATILSTKLENKVLAYRQL